MKAYLLAVWAYLVWYGHNLFCAVDQVVNALFGGWADETMSSHAYRLNRDTKPFGWLMRVYDVLFIWQISEHCKHAYEHELERFNFAPEMRSTSTTPQTVK
jgi:hypothetical protein